MSFYKRYFSLLIIIKIFLCIGCTGSNPPAQKSISSYSKGITSSTFNFQFVSPWQVILSWKRDNGEHYIYRRDCPDCDVGSSIKVSSNLNYFIDSASPAHGFIGNCWDVRNKGGDFLGRACLTNGADIFYVYVTQWNSEGVTSETRMYNLLRIVGYGPDSFLIDRKLPAANLSPITATASKNGVTLFFPRVISPPSFIPEYFSGSIDYPESAKTFPFATTLEILRCDYTISNCKKDEDFEVIDFIPVSGSYFDPVTGGSYCYRVLAINIYGSSGPSNTVCVSVKKKKFLKGGTSVVNVPLIPLEERMIEIYSRNATIAMEMDRVLMGDPRFFKFRLGRVEKVGNYYKEIYNTSLTEGVYNTLFFVEKGFNWWNRDNLDCGSTYGDLFKGSRFHFRCDLGYIFGNTTAGEPFSDGTRHYLLRGYFHATYLIIESPMDWNPGFDTYVNPATFGVDFSRDVILVLYLRPFDFQLSQSAFFFFQPVGAYTDSQGILHIVFASNGENYWRSGYVDSPDGVIIIGYEYKFPVYVVEGIILPKSIVETADPYKIVFEWDLFARYGDGVINNR